MQKDPVINKIWIQPSQIFQHQPSTEFCLMAIAGAASNF